MDLTLIIPAYNEEKILGACLEKTLENANGIFREIIVVNNASTDRTAEVASRYPVRVVHEPRKGLTSARQRGFEEATTELIAYLDADSYIAEDWASVAQQAFREEPHIVALSGPRRYYGAARMDLLILDLMWAPAPLAYRMVGYMILGGNFIVRRSAIEAIGGFNQNIAFYGEDTDIARRLSEVGKVRFRNDFLVYASARRFETEGIVKANATYLLNFVWPVVFKRPYTANYQDVREN